MGGLKFKLIFICSILFSTPVEYGDSPAEDLDTYYKSGLDLYQSRAYQNAKSAFEKVLENNWESPELYYNLGNVYYRLNDNSGAVWAYEMCLYHDPTHEDAKFNLKLVNVNVKDRIAIPDAPIYLKLYMGIKERFTPNEWVKITLGFFIICVSQKILGLFTNNEFLGEFCTHIYLHHISIFTSFHLDGFKHLTRDNLY